ncbi:Sec62/63 complex, subunit Sec66 [Cladorrhinum sp. PSN259]|nr:Sec62/63 complex, subunit Sec66 [Cladorrhinum sp. PSN259]
MFDINWRGLLLPLAYLAVLVGTFMTFSTVYRKRKAFQSANLAPWFGPHLQRNIYLSLLHMHPEEGSEKAPKIPDSVIRAALLRRAVEDIHRIIQIRTAKAACGSLLQRGSVGDDLWQRFQRAEKEMEDELRDVVLEANALVPGWGQIIFQSANEIAANKMLRDRLDEIEAQTEHEKEWWDKRRGAIRSEFMKELEESESKSVASHDEPVLVDTNSPA